MTTNRACDICESVEEKVFNFLCQYQADLISNAKDRAVHFERGGFCAFHTWQYNQMTSVRAACSSHSDFLQLLGDKLLALAMEPGSLEQLVHKLEQFPANHPDCIVCEVAAQEEKDALGAALDNLNSDPGADETPPLYCFPHLAALAAKCADPPKVRRLVERHGEEFRRVAEEMRQYAAKQDARRRDLLTNRESAASFLGLMLLAGRSRPGS